MVAVTRRDHTTIKIDDGEDASFDRRRQSPNSTILSAGVSWYWLTVQWRFSFHPTITQNVWMNFDGVLGRSNAGVNAKINEGRECLLMYILMSALTW